jgi:GntR family transcriptional regulator / MocR family aminotransferase
VAVTPLAVELRRDDAAPLHVQLAGQVRHRIAQGLVSPGARIPSSRALATDLGVSRAVVEQSYDQLLAEGWLVARRGSGTFVADVGSLPRQGPPGRPRAAPPPPRLVRLGTGTPWVDPRHEAAWRRAWRDVSVATPPADYPDPAGLAELRAEIAGYVARTRGLACTADEVLVTSGTTHGMGLVLDDQAPGAVGIEDPGYRAAVATATVRGRAVLDLPVDAEGVRCDVLAGTLQEVAAIYVTPAHQHPLGTTMSAARRVALLEEARRRGAVVLEDDYDSEFRYDVAPLPALAALDRRQVVHLGTTSKTLTPALRLGWAVADADRVARIAEQRDARHDHPPWPLQRALLTLMREGSLDKAVRSARRVYAARAARVASRLGHYGTLTTPVAGMYLTLLTPPPVARAVAHEAREADFEVPTLADYTRTDDRAGLVVGFGGVSDDALDAALGALEASLRRHA